MSVPTAADPVHTIDDVIARLTVVIDECREDESRIGYFAALYRRITIAVKAAIADGTFEDGARMERLDVTFASRYLDAVDAYRRGAQPEAAWAFVFRAARMPFPLVMQHLLIAVNVHVDYDLGIAAAQVCPGAAISGLKTDFFTLNTILAGEVDKVRGELSRINILLRLTDVFSRVEDKLVDLAVNVGRDHAWSFATQLAGASPQEQKTLRATYENETRRIGRDVLLPGVLAVVVYFVRMFERGTVREKIDILATP
jgi:hypothetical protein